VICHFDTRLFLFCLFNLHANKNHSFKNRTMETANATKVTIESIINAPAEKVWKYWTSPEHITRWNSPSPDWHSPRAENDVRVGGKFMSRMEARDGSAGFDFGGVYDEVNENARLAYTMGDGRKVTVDFTQNGNETKVVETFDAETMHPVDFQRAGWQAILDNFKNYVENN
jgi:uncharacterized protein YndB with AHSA1/START domain